MALSDFDRNLIERCMQKQAVAWEEFVDRFGGLVSFIVQTTCKARNFNLDPMTHDDLVQEVFVRILSENFVVLRRFRGNCSLASYLTVIARRVTVKALLTKYMTVEKTNASEEDLSETNEEPVEAIIENMDEILYLISHLPERDAKIVRMYHLEQKSYAEIAAVMGIPENSVGPILSRARDVMRQNG